MKEDNNNNLRQTEANIREAIRREEMARPPMPSDLNARLMQRVAEEVNCEKPRQRTHRIWPWLAAAACVAGVIVMLFTPPKSMKEVAGGTVTAKMMKDSVKHQTVEVKEPEPQLLTAKAEAKPVKDIPKSVKKKTPKESTPLANDNLTAQAEEAGDTLKEVVNTDIAMAKPTTERPEPRILSDRDIPITRPENYKYTKEELQLMKEQAKEAYLKWVELEIEIAKYNLEQTAQK